MIAWGAYIERTFQSSGEIHNQLSFRFRPGLVLFSFNFCLPHIVFNSDSLAYDQNRLYIVMLFYICCVEENYCEVINDKCSRLWWIDVSHKKDITRNYFEMSAS